MNALTPRPRQHPSVVFGSPRRWVRDGTLVGTVSAYLGASHLFGLSMHPSLVAAAVTGGLLGAIFGSVGYAFLGEARGRFPLPVVALAIPGLAVGIATAVSWWAAVLTGAPTFPAVVFGVTAAALLATVFWLPYAVVSAMDLPRWPVVLTAMVISPATGPLAALVGTVL